MIIAIDGPSGAGKSTVSKAVALAMGFASLDTGAMYRSVAWRALEDGIDLNDHEAVGRIAREQPIAFAPAPGPDEPQRVFIGGVDVTEAIRTARIDKVVSIVAAQPDVRTALTAQQQRIGHEGDYVVEGRDIGTVVFPDAEVKVFLTASNEERARRRVEQNKARGIGSTDFDEVLADLLRRDEIDSARDTAPLRAADDAVLIDSSELSIEEVIERICTLARTAQESAC